MKALWVMIIFLSIRSWAMPEYVEVIFIGPPTAKKVSVLDFWHPLYQVAENNFSQRKCLSGFSEDCFDPRFGTWREEGETAKEQIEHDKKVKDQFISATKTSMITCDKDFYFDMFCGKAQDQVEKAADVEVWIDTSSSLRSVDYQDTNGNCFRKSFVDRLRSVCEIEKIDFYGFDTSKKLLQTSDEFCRNYGLNSEDKIIQWLKDSKAKKVLLITDISEYSKRIADFLFEIGAVVIGAEKDVLIASDLLSRIDIYQQKFCSKKK